MTIDVTAPRLPGAEAAHLSAVTPAEDARTIMINQISWGAVLAGIVMTLVVQLVLTMLGGGIGILTVDPASGGTPGAGTFTVLAGLWWVASGITSSAIGGYAAGRLSGRPKESTAAWHGVAAWAGSTLVVIYLLTTAVAGVVGGVFTAIGGVAQTAAQVAGPALASANPLTAIEDEVRVAAGGDDPAALRDAAVAGIRAVMTADEAGAATAREEAAAALARARSIPIEQARTEVAGYEAEYRAAVAEAAEVAEAAANTAGLAALFAAIGLVLGGVAAAIGGRSGVVTPTVTAGMTTRRVFV